MKRLLLIAALSVALFGCSHTPPNNHTTGINHVVLIWLKEPANQQHRQTVISASEELKSIPGIEKLRAGEALPSDRKIVDDSFDVGVYMLFKNKSAMQRYTSHPEHVEIVKSRIAPLAEKIVIYDF